MAVTPPPPPAVSLPVYICTNYEPANHDYARGVVSNNATCMYVRAKACRGGPRSTKTDSVVNSHMSEIAAEKICAEYDGKDPDAIARGA